MSTVLGRVAALVGMAWVLPGCLEYALIQALEEDNEEDISYDEGRFDSEIFAGGGGGGGDTATVPDDPAIDAPVDLRGGSLLGDMGRVQGFADEEPMLRGWSSDGYTNIEVHAQAADGSGAAMAILGLSGELADPSLEPGAHLEFNQFDYPTTGIYLSLIGCSGPAEGSWEFDQSATTVVVDVSAGETPDSKVLDFTATFQAVDGYDTASSQQTVVGSVEVGTTHPDAP